VIGKIARPKLIRFTDEYPLAEDTLGKDHAAGTAQGHRRGGATSAIQRRCAIQMIVQR